MNSSLPTELQLDALREVANIGCGQAASALSRLVGGRRVSIEVPRALVARDEDLPDLIGGDDAQVVAASLGMVGELSGHMLLVLPEAAAQRLVGLLLNTPGEGSLREDQLSAFAETANILASACLSAIGKLADYKLMPSVPKLSLGSAGAVVDEALARVQRPAGMAVVLEARFSTSGAEPIEGQLLVIPDIPSLKRLLERLGV